MFVIPMDTPGIRVVPDEAAGRPQHQLHVLRGRAGAGHGAGRRREPGLEPHHQPAQPRAGHAVLAGHHRAGPRPTCGPGPRPPSCPTAGASIDQEWVQEHLARVHAELEFLRLINWKVAWQATQGHLDVADASSIKVFGTEFYLRAFRSLMEIIGQAGYLTRGSPAAVDRRSSGDVRPLHDHPHLRWRHQRDSAGPHRDLRPRHAAVAALSPPRARRAIPWISATAKSRRPSASWPDRSSATGRRTSG